MVKRRPKVRVVGKDEGGDTSVFDDMEKLRADLAAASGAPICGASSATVDDTPNAGSHPLRRPRSEETFARIPHDRALELYRRRINGSAWMALIELDRMILAQRGQNPVLFWSPRLRAAGLTKHTRWRALRQLEAAGVVKIEQEGKGASPRVRHLWYPRRG
jgi:hypothetical protein